jgi:hypothetical protein
MAKSLRNWRGKLVGAAIVLPIVAGVTIHAFRLQNRENERLKVFSEQMRAKLAQREDYLNSLIKVDLNFQAQGRFPSSPYGGVAALKVPYPTVEQMEERLGKPDKSEDFTGILRVTWSLGDLSLGSIRDPASYTQADFSKENGELRLRRLRMVDYAGGDKARRRTYATVIGRTGYEWSSSETPPEQTAVH